MIQSLFSSQSLSRLHFQQSFDESQTFLIDFAKIFFIDGIQILYFWEFHSEKSLILYEALMQLCRQWSKCFLNEEKLIEFILSGKQRIAINQLTHNATDCPHINFFTIVSTDQKLRWTIPSCSDIVSHFHLSFFLFGLTGETKVTYFEIVARTH